MDLSIFIAKLYAIVFIAVGLGMLLSGDYYKKAMTDMLKSSGMLYLGGLIALVVGFLIVSYHNVWEQSWVVLITILGWLAIVKGVALLMFPQTMVDISSGMMKQKNMTVWGVLALILGLVLGYFSLLA